MALSPETKKARALKTRQALEEHNGNTVEAAKALGITITTLKRRLAASYEIEAENLTQPTLADKFLTWFASAQKGEFFECFRGNLEDAAVSWAEFQNLRGKQRHRNKVKAARAKGIELPKPHDPYGGIRLQARALYEALESAQMKGAIRLDRIVLTGPDDMLYVAHCLVQRNGLKAVRERAMKLFRERADDA